MKYLQSCTTLEVHIVMTKFLQSSATQEQNDSEGSGWSQVAEVGAGDRKAKIDGLNTGDRWATMTMVMTGNKAMAIITSEGKY